jgi:hypothetical protein
MMTEPGKPTDALSGFAAQTLPERRSHRIVWVILRYLPQIGSEHLAAGGPDPGQDGFLNGEIAS